MRARVPLVWLACLLAVGGCSRPAPPQPLVTPSPTQALEASAQAPLNFRHIKGTGFQLSVPSDYEESITELGNGVVVSQWVERHPNAPVSTAVSVVKEPGGADAYAQGAALELRLRGEGVAVQRSGVTWPDAKSGQLFTWVEVPRGSQDRRQVWQLMLQNDKGEIYNVVAFAPETTFVSSELPKAVATFAMEA